MMPPQRPPGGRIPEHLANPNQLQGLQERVAQQYGAFGAQTEEAAFDERVFADSWFKPAVQLIGGVFLAAIFLFFVSHPHFDAPGAWANSFRLDTFFVVVWGPLL